MKMMLDNILKMEITFGNFKKKIKGQSQHDCFGLNRRLLSYISTLELMNFFIIKKCIYFVLTELGLANSVESPISIFCFRYWSEVVSQ